MNAKIKPDPGWYSIWVLLHLLPPPLIHSFPLHLSFFSLSHF
jgi:hypothetical protein